MLIGLISDTHVGAKRDSLPERVFELFHGVDLIVHAGDITQKKVLDELDTIAPVVAVLGNNDKLDLKGLKSLKRAISELTLTMQQAILLILKGFINLHVKWMLIF